MHDAQCTINLGEEEGEMHNAQCIMHNWEGKFFRCWLNGKTRCRWAAGVAAPGYLEDNFQDCGLEFNILSAESPGENVDFE